MTKADQRPGIREAIVVEGRDDTAAVLAAVEAVTIETHGYGISGRTWEKLEAAYRSRGLIVLTDPDHAGEMIRRRVTERFPEAKQAFLTRDLAEKKGDIGIENAAPEDILQALTLAHGTVEERHETFTTADLVRYGLAGGEGARERRETLGRALGIGYSNSRTFLKRLNDFGVTREAFEEAAARL